MLSERLERLKAWTRDRGAQAYKQDVKLDLTAECEAENLSWTRRRARFLRRMLEAEKPVILPDERIVFTRTVPITCNTPMPKVDQERRQKEFTTGVSPANICADWHLAMRHGLLDRRRVAEEGLRKYADDQQAVEFLTSAIETLDAVLDLVKRYAAEARRVGRNDIAEMLDRVPANAPKTFHEALQSFRIIHSMLYESDSCHVTLGRFDQYMWPFFSADIEAGRLTVAEAEELLAEFFIALSRDIDYYPGVQRGDNGQSLMLGGCKSDGSDATNELTHMCLRVSYDVNMIEPKINLRVNKDTSLEILKEAAKLTRRGLGFPQYSNDDVVIPGLVNLGYDIKDAREYTVAACWEFIIPGVGMEVPNINALSFPAAVDRGVREGLAAQENFDQILDRTRRQIREQVRLYTSEYTKPMFWPAPWYSCWMTDCLEKGKDVGYGGAKYYNYGIHGSGSANAADALAAVKTLVFDEKKVDAAEMVNALITNWENAEPLRQFIVENAPHVGNNDDRADSMLALLFDMFADACAEAKELVPGRIVRAGTGTAMFYWWLSDEKMCAPIQYAGATADGRRKGDMYSSSLAPSPGIKVRGPLSVLQSYGKLPYDRVCNGGPITMELSDTVFRNDEALEKVALLIRAFAQLGCQQLQLNSLNPQILRDAKKHPERHRNLIVRVWGWSGYFVELDEHYQDQIIARTAHLTVTN